MELEAGKEILIGVGIIWMYLLIRYVIDKKNKPDLYKELLTNEEYKVKGQWNR